jgi:hypothetical protein
MGLGLHRERMTHSVASDVTSVNKPKAKSDWSLNACLFCLWHFCLFCCTVFPLAYSTEAEEPSLLTLLLLYS